MIPKNVTIITKEMIKQLEVEQRQIQKELEIYNGWISQSRIYFVKLQHKINKELKKFKKNSMNNKITSFLFFKRWAI